MHRRDSLRAEKILQKKLFERVKEGKVFIEWDSTLEEVIGNDMGVTGIKIKSVNDNSINEFELEGYLLPLGIFRILKYSKAS